jgi:ankyrin repeat protein
VLVQEVTVKAKGDVVGELAFIFRLRHLFTACVGKTSSTLFTLPSDSYQHVCSTYLDDASKVVEAVIQTVASGGSAGKSQASGTSQSSLHGSRYAQQKVNEEIRRHTEQYAAAYIDAAAQNDIVAVSRFLDSGRVDVDESDYDERTALHLAASNGHAGLVRLLVERYGASHTLKDRYGGSPLNDAIREGHMDIVKYLQDLSQTSTIDSVYAGKFIQAAADNNLKTIEILYASRLDPNCCDHNHRTALHLSVCNRSRDVFLFLLALPGIQLAPVDRMGHTPLWDAIMDDNQEFAHLLRNKGAPVQHDIAADLCQAASNNDTDFFERLHGLDIDVSPRVRLE